MSKWIEKLLSNPLPERVSRLPRDERGFPIPHSVMYDTDGKPDFRVVDMVKWLDAIQTEKCGICGERLDYHKFFIGGPRSMESRMFFDLPMHEECARYALVTCPYLALPRFTYAKEIEMEGIALSPHSGTVNTRPEKFGLYKTRNYSWFTSAKGEPYIKAGAQVGAIEWFEPESVD